MVGMSSWRSSPTSDRVAVAVVMGVRGLRGDLRVEFLTDWPERLQVGSEVMLEGEDQPRRIVSLNQGGRTPVVRLEGIDTRAAAVGLIGRGIERQPASLPAGSYWWHELEGLEVFNERGSAIGTLAEVFRAGANEVYRVVGPGGERLVPALHAVVVEIDLAARRMVVRDEADYVADP